jgi:hypothetical protein
MQAAFLFDELCPGPHSIQGGEFAVSSRRLPFQL